MTPTPGVIARCTRCHFRVTVKTITDADRILDAHHQSRHVHPDYRKESAK